MIGRRRYLGLAVQERRVVAAEVERAHGGHRVTRTGEFALPEGTSWDDPAGVGEALAPWLKEHGLTRDAVVGIPSRWLVTAVRDVPPVGREALVGMLRLAAERAFSVPRQQLLCDYASAPPEGEAGEALLVGARRERVQAATEAVHAAGGKVHAVSPTAAALAMAGAPGPDAVTAHLTPDGAEVTLTRDGVLKAIRHVPIPEQDGTAAAGALHLGVRSVLGAGAAGIERVRVYDGRALETSELTAVSSALGLDMDTDPTLPVEGLAEAAKAAGMPPGRAAPAAALALAGFQRELIPFDLTEPRLARRRQRHWARPAAWAGFVLLVSVVAVAAVLMDRRAAGREVADLRARWQQMQPSIEAAEQVVETVDTARGWYDRRPPFLDCLVALTLTFPEEGSIWATNLAIQEDAMNESGVSEQGEGMRGVLSGKATSEQSVLDVLENVKGPGKFSQVRLLYIRETRGAAGDIAFSVAFSYSGAERR
ncbi:MAG: hypothetical protein R6X33_18545 [Candidatus Brocadiia bacterium]